jgi:UDPglucose 6-dehydrogenase
VNGERKEPLAIFGAGWVGLVTGACFADLGHAVRIRDVVPEKIERLREGELSFFEPGLAELGEKNRKRRTVTLDAAEAAQAAELLFVCVDTPPTYSGDADLSRVWTVIDELPRLERRVILVQPRTGPVGTGDHVRPALEARGRDHIGYVSNPEFLAEGGAVRDFMHPDRVVVGSFAAADGERVAGLYAEMEAPIVRADVASAEMIKLAANAFLATRISFINEIANVCEVTGADVEKVAEGVGLDHRLGPHFLKAGVGFGGSCFPKDTSALKQLASNSGYHFQLLSAVIEVNELQKRRVINKLQKYLGRLRGKRIALLGLAFKANTDDMREAPSVVLASRLLAEGADVRAYDPVAKPGDLVSGMATCDSVAEAVRDADAAVIVTDWDEFRSIVSAELRDSMRRPLIIDGRNLLDPDEARTAGFTYEGIGRASSPLAALPETDEREPELAE